MANKGFSRGEETIMKYNIVYQKSNLKKSWDDFFNGIDEKIYERLGVHKKTHNGNSGLEFLVWAPNAKKINVVGEFNFWYGKDFSMKKIDDRGIWQIFIAGLNFGDMYKYEIELSENEKIYKADPFAYYAEKRPQTASITYNLNDFSWNDQKWLSNRKKVKPYNRPINIYEVHLASWKKKQGEGNYNYRELGDLLVSHVLEMGYTHIELMPIMEHPYDGSWGYQATGYFASTSRYGEPKDLMYLIDKCHNANIGVILDWVPCHFCNDEHGLKLFDGGPAFESSNKDMAENIEWGTTNFDLKKSEVQNFLLSNAYFWLKEYHVDGIRVDAVAFMLYLDYGKKSKIILNEDGTNENKDAIKFFNNLSKVVYKEFPNILLIAEESTAWPLVTAPTYEGGLGFNFKWNLGWMNDILRYMETEPNQRKYYHHLMTFSLTYAFSENFILPFSHDEVVHGKKSLLDKMPGDYFQKFSNLRLLYGYMMGHPGKKHSFMGNEFGQFIEWDENRELDWFLLNYEKHEKTFEYMKALNKFYKKEASFYHHEQSFEGFQWLDVDNAEQSILAFMRTGMKEDAVIVISNFTSEVHKCYKLGIPVKQDFREVLNSDCIEYGGSGINNKNIIKGKNKKCNNFSYSIEVDLPPLSTVYLKMIQHRKNKNSKK